jgi:hypothetical protein
LESSGLDAIEALSGHSPGMVEENHKKFGQDVSCYEFELGPRTFLIK